MPVSVVIDFRQKFLPVDFSVTGGRDTLRPAEKTAEIQRVVIPDDRRNVADRIIRGLQKRLGVPDPDLKDILHGRCARGASEAPAEPARGHAA